jgi:spoIIIJ-associated protein
MSQLDIETVRSALENFLSGLLRAGRFHLRFRIEPAEGDSGEIRVLLDGEDADLLLQRGGELLTALEHVAARALRLTTEEQGHLLFDCQDFRALRVAELCLTAETAAERTERTGQPFALSPMNARERRIVHLALKDRAGVRTESEGTGAHRRVVIYPQTSR